ncbi:LuxR C-terminal-related transcriptional regulator [Kibdelosporangium aridum]|uniref:DNA-binding response regulator, NarL/FixJ family, contains REC and HTH domains n=1 Tax=Kibdelosporangium aridum TaxID=2030 RepID=A0A1W2FI08_KIBAR|nr:response regulator transcription factor [Kibdelosporangium aridum]SMD21510.1 DNA-binding response regulator, NarL/FixJ family, contains REC and HTH domains [Kibdelosporangium aridum]
MNVVLADSHPIVRCGLKAMLAMAGGINVVADVDSGDAANTAIAQHRPDVLVIEVGELPAVQSVKDTAVIVFTTRDDEHAIRSAIKAGVRGYILKTADDTDIVRAIRSVAAGELIFGRPVAARLAGVFQPIEQPFATLTSRQRQVADLVAGGLGNNAIATRLGLTPKTVRNHISQILTTLGLPTRAELRRVAS